MTKLLLLYGSRYGSTAEIAEKMEEIFTDHDIEVKLVNLEETKLRNLPSFDEFDGLLIGSGIKIKRMTKNVRKFLKKNAHALNKEGQIVGIFVSCGTADDPEERPKARKEYIENILKRYNIKADMYEAFGGKLDLTEDSNLGFFSKKIMGMAAKEDLEIEQGETNDNRDWEFISNFAKAFCNLLKR
ncbi:MAG: flavodoxin domain-containing protein [Promethearchaeia archaeon]